MFAAAVKQQSREEKSIANTEHGDPALLVTAGLVHSVNNLAGIAATRITRATIAPR